MKNSPSQSHSKVQRVESTGRVASVDDDVQQEGERESASDRATQKARRGEPLDANRPSERSPKQENL
jgi:hypothetical protein